MRYRNLVFDVGGVLLSYRWKEMLTEDYGMEEALRDEFAGRIFRDPLWVEFDLENISYEDVVEGYVSRYPEYEEPIRWLFSNTDRMPVSRPEIWRLVRRCRQAGYRIFLLSNYGSRMFRNHTEGLPFLEDIDGGVISYQIHRIKPDAAIYEELFRRYQLIPSECLFFDDREENVRGSAACGMDAVRIVSEEQLAEELRQLIAEAEG